MERFLQLSDEPYTVDPTLPRNPNWHIINPTTPAQYFHALRRQMCRPFRKPLVVIGPKTLLKSSAAVSAMEQLKPGTTFLPVLDDSIAPEQVQKVCWREWRWARVKV